jgi:hypothetical protein
MTSTPDLPQKLGDFILNLALEVPVSTQTEISQPRVKAQALGRMAARQASLIAGTLALPPGFWGWFTVLPELVGVWKLQAQLVSDIAAIYGKTSSLGREQMLYCLFKHVSAQLFRDVVVRVGERYLIQRASLPFFQSAARILGVKVSQQLMGKGISRFLPLVGAAGVSAYAYFDTLQVGKTAIDLFSREAAIHSQKL